MNHSVPPPSLPPDIDDLYTPPQHLRAGVMAKHVWSFMRLSLTNTDWAWCTVCRKWCRYHKAFHDEHIKALFKHCKHQHVLDSSSGRVCPINPSTASSPSQPPYRQLQTHNPNLTQVSIPANTTNPLLDNQPTSALQFPQAHLQLARAQAARNQLAMFSNLPSSSTQPQPQPQPQPNPSLTPHQHLQAAVATMTNPVPPASGPVAFGPPRLTTALHSAPARPRSRISVHINPSAAAAAFTHLHNLAVPSQTPVPPLPLAHPAPRDPHPQPGPLITVQQLDHLQRLQRLLESGAHMQVQAPLRPVPPLARHALAFEHPMLPEMTVAASTATHPHAHAARLPAVGPPSTGTDTGAHGVLAGESGAGGRDRAMARGAAAACNVQNLSNTNGVTPQISSLHVNGVNNLAGVSGPTPSPAQTHRLPNRAAMTMSQIPATSPATVSNSPSPIRPLQGAIAKKSANPNHNRSHLTKIRCEASAQVRKVAERSQQLMFKGTNLYFANASFQVPSSEAEAIEIMRKGTYDVDKDNDGRPANDLYLVSWSHTQFFAAQMAALGYRFVSSNLRRSVKQTTPPPVNEWLLLEKYQPVARPPQAPSNAPSQASGLSIASSASPPVQGLAQGPSPTGGQAAAFAMQVETSSSGNTTASAQNTNLVQGAREADAASAQPAGTGQLYSNAAAPGVSNGHGNVMGRRGPAVIRATPGVRLVSPGSAGNVMHGNPTGQSRPKRKPKEIPIIDLT